MFLDISWRYSGISVPQAFYTDYRYNNVLCMGSTSNSFLLGLEGFYQFDLGPVLGYMANAFPVLWVVVSGVFLAFLPSFSPEWES